MSDKTRPKRDTQRNHYRYRGGEPWNALPISRPMKASLAAFGFALCLVVGFWALYVTQTVIAVALFVLAAWALGDTVWQLHRHRRDRTRNKP